MDSTVRNRFIIAGVVVALIVFAGVYAKLLEASQPQYTINDIVVTDGYQFTVLDVTKKVALEGFFVDSKPKGVFVVVNVEVKNIGKESQPVGDGLFTLKDNQENEFDAFKFSNNESRLNPQFSTKETIIYDIPVNSAGLTLNVRSNYLGIGSGTPINLGQ